MTTLTEDQIKNIVRHTLMEEREVMAEKQEKEVLKATALILKGFGIDEKEEAEVREDFRYLRRWRKGSDRITGLGLTAIVTLVVGGLMSAFVLGIKQMMGK